MPRLAPSVALVGLSLGVLAVVTAADARSRRPAPQQLRLDLRHLPAQQNAAQQNAAQQNAAQPNPAQPNPALFGHVFGGPHHGQPAALRGFEGALTDRALAAAIDEAIHFLESRQAEDGSIGEGQWARGGSTALAALAMLASGAAPASDPTLKRALGWLSEIEPDNTYVVAIRANVWEYALRTAPNERRWRDALEKDFRWLLEARNERGFRYGIDSQDWDNSCTQYGVLGIWAAERAGFEAGDAFWQAMSDHFRAVQNEDGGWGYQRGGSSPNMATAGLASLFLVFDNFHARQVFRRGAPRTQVKAQREILEALRRGMTWLGESSGDKANSYYLYGIERAGVASGRRTFGGEDWFRTGAAAALARRTVDGAISMGYGPVVSTSFVTLFLVYGGAPMAINKLEYGLSGDARDWDLNPRDLANLSKWLWEAYERPVGWQIVSIDAPVESFEAPILWITGSAAWNPSEADVEKLRAYVARGGTLLVEPSDHSSAFRAAAEQLAGRIRPGTTLAAVDPGDPLLTVTRHTWKTAPALRAAHDGSRHWFLLSDGYLSADWQSNDTDSDAFHLAMSVLFYVTDRGQLRPRFQTAHPEGPAVAADASVRVARAYVGDDGLDRAAAGWRAMRAHIAHAAGVTIEDGGVVSLDAPIPKDVAVLHVNGRGVWNPSAAERDVLNAFSQRGGVLLVDAWAGDSAFARSSKAALAGTDLAPRSGLDGSPIQEGRFEGGADLSEGLRLTLAGRDRLPAGAQPDALLEVAARDRRVTTLFSPVDLAAALGDVRIYGSAGYKPRSARRIVGNLLTMVARPPE
jgi:hypothetical protein